MRIKTRLIITALAMMLSMAAFGQSPIKVKEFRMLPNGIMDAGVLTKEQQTDYDGNKVCLIKVRAFGIGEETMQRLTFKTNGPFITHKEYENGEYRLYVSSNREGSIVIRYNGDCEYILPSRLKEGKIYEMVLEMETGTLTVVATPVEAKIYVDDAYAGTGSVNVQVSVGAEHRCRVECQDYIKVEKTVSFAKNEEKTLTVELVPNFGYITVKSEPSGAELYIDDKKAGTTPYLARRISRGQHRVEVRKRGYEPYADVVTININETTRIEDVKLEASNEVVSIPQQQEQYSPQQEYGGGFSNQTITVNGVSFEMVYVEGGSFNMGATTEQGSEAESDEKPVHSVTLSDYYIGRCEVTQELWEAVMGSNPSYFKGAQKPVESVSWNDCQEFVSRLNSLTGRTFRLPTEAEWEYAARGGNKSLHYKYSGSGNIGNVAWYFDNSGSSTHAVGTRTANELGIYDMSGNVREWCSDWYGDYSAGAQTNPQGPSSGSRRVLRGGSWFSDAGCCQVSYRSATIPDINGSNHGLRLVLVPNEVTSIPQQQEYVGGFSNQTITVNGVNFEMVYVEGGSFDMGATTEQGSDAYKDEYPAHSVTLSDYYIGRCEVTQELWEAVMGSNPSYFKGAQNPVECVSWNDCQEFVSRLSSLTGRTFRLPTEAEWEYAARGGNKSGHYKYSGIGNIDDVAWYWKNSGDRYLQGTDSDYDRDKIINNNGRTHAVGTKTANELGIYDMSGNVYEWCSDWYGDYSAGTQTNPQGPSSGSDRVLRGGSWYGRAWCCRVSFRIYNDPNDSSDLDGLRLVLVP